MQFHGKIKIVQRPIKYMVNCHSTEKLSHFSLCYDSFLPPFGTPVAYIKASELMPLIAVSRRVIRRKPVNEIRRLGCCYSPIEDSIYGTQKHT